MLLFIRFQALFEHGSEALGGIESPWPRFLCKRKTLSCNQIANSEREPISVPKATVIAEQLYIGIGEECDEYSVDVVGKLLEPCCDDWIAMYHNHDSNDERKARDIISSACIVEEKSIRGRDC